MKTFAKMAVVALLKNHTKVIQEVFSSKLYSIGITEMKDLAFILGSKSDASKVAEEILVPTIRQRFNSCWCSFGKPQRGQEDLFLL